ncbi:2-acylglycerol O-acyltransferase 2-A-like [Protobothrops mucrosquamatus]|uniref:2-acylglycerol O-acyltransferase 2-A-like n=1 Tax=Protobothrops mucrosquamatus TaxID=103944 RepID=UPI000775A925|nr:2-acylglycerol O-acyltransferase 2-A-like [Protobothrops mucrosquamatus]
MKIEFAPRHIPWERRLQTASVLQWVFCFLFMAQCSIAVFILLLFTRFWLISALYAAWWAFDWDTPSKGGRRSHWMRNSVVWRYVKDYFPISGMLEILCEFCEILLWRKGLIPSDKESASYVLRKKEGGNIVIIAVGGAQEALDARPGAYTLLLENRKGFVRLAIENGTPLVPVFSFGENELYDQVENPKGSWLRWTQDRLQKIMRFSVPLFHARGIFQYTFGFIPYRKPIFTVVGKPIQLVKKHNPSRDEVDELHKRYLEALCKLFEEHKLKYNVPEDTHLSFI